MKYQYDVAISYKSEIENKAMKIADYLMKDGWKVFIAPVEQQELLSEKIHQELYDIYRNKSLLKLLLVSENYCNGEWTALEMRMSLESTKNDRKRLLIVNYTDRLTLPGNLQELQYLNGKKFREDEIASIVTERIEKYFKKNKKEIEQEKQQEKRSSVNIKINNGIITGDNTHFGDIQL